MARDDTRITDVEASLVAHWSHLGRWERGALVEEGGTLRYETPIPHIPYNGVVRTRIDGDADTLIASVLGGFRDRGVSPVWWVHPTAEPAGLGDLLSAHGLTAVEEATGMSLDLAEWDRPEPDGTVSYVEVAGEPEVSAYCDLIVSYWELPAEARALVIDLSRAYAPGRVAAHRWIAVADGRPIGKAMLTVAGPPGVAGVYGMSVLPEARGKGVAGGLTTTMLRRAKELGCERVVLQSTGMGRGVYERAGFVPCCDFTVYANEPIWGGHH